MTKWTTIGLLTCNAFGLLHIISTICVWKLVRVGATCLTDARYQWAVPMMASAAGVATACWLLVLHRKLKRSDKSSLLLLNAFFQTILCGSQFLIAVVPSVGLLYAPLWEACKSEECIPAWHAYSKAMIASTLALQQVLLLAYIIRVVLHWRESKRLSEPRPLGPPGDISQLGVAEIRRIAFGYTRLVERQ